MIAVLMTVMALAFILPSLLGKQKGSDVQARSDQLNLAVLRDQLNELDRDLAAGTIDKNAHDIARRELEQRVAEDVQPILPATMATTGRPIHAMLIGLGVMIGAAGLYAHLGKPDGLDPAKVAAVDANSPDTNLKDADTAVKQLAELLKKQPNNPEGWHLLARALNSMGRYSDASGAYAQLVTLVPANAHLFTEYAGALAMAQGGTLQGEPEKLLARALEADPKNTKALALTGSAEFERGDYGSAITRWEKVLTLAPADSEIVRVATDNIKEARAASATTGNQPMLAAAPVAPRGGTQPVGAQSSTKTTPQATQVAGTVELDPALRSEVSDSDTIFIFARATEGPRFPLAVLRKQVKDLPVNFVLDDSMSMIPDAKLSGFSSLVVGARISKTGNATPSVGDLEGSVASVRPGASGVKIRIDSRRK
jgi:cytochrome c-type biogenesis protein CcmH